MRELRSAALIALLFLPSIAAAQTPLPLTLEDAIAKGKATAPRLLENQAREEAAVASRVEALGVEGGEGRRAARARDPPAPDARPRAGAFADQGNQVAARPHRAVRAVPTVDNTGWPS